MILTISQLFEVFLKANSGVLNFIKIFSKGIIIIIKQIIMQIIAFNNLNFTLFRLRKTIAIIIKLNANNNLIILNIYYSPILNNFV